VPPAVPAVGAIGVTIRRRRHRPVTPGGSPTRARRAEAGGTSLAYAVFGQETTMSAHGELRTPSHLKRNASLVTGAVVAIAAIWAFGQYSFRQDTSRLSRFDAFRVAYAEKCNVPSYSGPIADVIRDDYLTSPPIQAEVDRQLAALANGSSCSEVVKKLKSVDLVVPAPGPT
jgi:hypothetical protein